MNQIETTFAGGSSPWETHRPAKPTMKKQKPAPRIDPSALQISNDPLPTARVMPNKYWPVFAKMKPGQNVRCLPGDAAAISQALRKYIENHNVMHDGVLCKVISQSSSEDGIGRVWLVSGKKAAS